MKKILLVVLGMLLMFGTLADAMSLLCFELMN